MYVIGNSDTDEGLLFYWHEHELRRKIINWSAENLFAIISGMWVRVWATRAILHSICQLQVAIIKINWSSTPCSVFICRRENRVHFALVSVQSKQLQQTNFVTKRTNCSTHGAEDKGTEKIGFRNCWQNHRFQVHGTRAVAQLIDTFVNKTGMEQNFCVYLFIS